MHIKYSMKFVNILILSHNSYLKQCLIKEALVLLDFTEN